MDAKMTMPQEKILPLKLQNNETFSKIHGSSRFTEINPVLIYN